MQHYMNLYEKIITRYFVSFKINFLLLFSKYFNGIDLSSHFTHTSKMQSSISVFRFWTLSLPKPLQMLHVLMNLSLQFLHLFFYWITHLYSKRHYFLEVWRK